MPNSLKSKLSSLRYKRLITDEEYKELIKKLNGHDNEIRIKVIDEFVKTLKEELNNYDFWKQFNKSHDWIVEQIAEQMKGGAEC